MAQLPVEEKETDSFMDLEKEDSVINEFIAIALGDKYDDIDDNNIQWTKHKTNDKDISIDYAYIKKANIMTVRSSVTVPFGCDEFHDFVNAYKDGIFECIKEYDPMCLEIGAIKRYDEDRCLVYSAYNAPVPKIIYPRDFCYVKARRLCKNYKDTSHYLAVDVCYSVPDTFPDYKPLNKNRVRGHLYMAGLLFEKIDDSTSRAYYILQLDPKGWIPTWVVNLTAPQQGYNIKWVRDLKKRRKEMHENNDDVKSDQ